MSELRSNIRLSVVAVLVPGMLLAAGALAGCNAPESRTAGATASQSPTRVAEATRESGNDAATGAGSESTASAATETGTGAGDPTTEPSSERSADTNERTSFSDGVVRVGDRVEEGSYAVTEPVESGCILSVAVDPTGVNLGGEEINVTGTGVELGDVSTAEGVTRFEIVAGNPTIALAEGDTVTSQGCGTWRLQ